MNEIIKIEARELGGVSVQTCNARDLWAFVESKQDFSDWIKNRIQKYGFLEGEDYLFHKFMENPSGGRPTLDYHLTIDAGKELAMVENNAKGREVRRYFIDCERRAKESAGRDPMQALHDPATMRSLLLAYSEKLLTAESKVAALAPKAVALDRIADASGAMNLTLSAKALQVQPKKLMDYLRDKHWIYRRPGGSGNVAYQDKIQAGYLTHKITTVQREDGTDKVVEQVLVTGKGLARLSQVMGVGVGEAVAA
jgi:anti-repressor protein